MAKATLAAFGQTDKWQHVIVSCAIMLDSLWFYALIPSVLITFGIGLLKEIWDQNYGSGFCWYDLLANGLGIAMAIGLRYCLTFIH